MADNVFNITEEGLQRLKDELEMRLTTKRKEITEAIGVALSFGDISENSEYDEAKDEQGRNEARIAELTNLIKSANVVSAKDINTDSVNVGVNVKVYDEEFDEEVVYAVVGSSEANPAENRISDQSPIGQALIGKKVGEIAVVKLPDGDVKLKVLEITV